ncbi:hypothetical protein C7H19_10680 [Aphanothece hegewaldii CCALA 016]|uniref:Uncharacterized protein n=1 Tax=Aphanothece hegewaldii CCALA 016 TaxID=2107694 RepID=A0A2T1LYB4_9CHRO|nr:hypothetical protein [Aphanothece hegewaldii]PSF37383.1 hypothetical protein C7H19_10680 [Aphanothece hegewaldii CCALA 016]
MEIISQTFLQEQLTLIIEIEIGRKMDNIIPNIKALAKSFSIAEKDKKSPFRNVLAVANESGSSIEIIKNYIRYQVGRSGSSPIWRISRDNKLFATALLEQINSLNQDAQSIVDRLRHSIRRGDLYNYIENGENREQIKKNIHLKLTQLYLGYLAREHTALCGEQNSKKEHETKSNPKLA